MSPTTKVRFGPFLLDCDRRVLMRDGLLVPLPPKALDTLVELVEKAGTPVVTKEELLQRVWPDTFVEEGNLAYTISILRKALNEDGDRCQYIETVPKRGYRFVAPIEHLPMQEASGELAPVREEPAQGLRTLRTEVRLFRLSPAWRLAWAATAALIVTAVGLWRSTAVRPSSPVLEYTRLTSFPDSVHSPALSRDGKMLAFIRGPVTFLGGPGEIYLKVLPDGQPTPLTQDADVKLAPVFAPDGSRVVYTDTNKQWSSFSVPLSGGGPALFMANAAALTWIRPGQVLFSETKRNPHMGIVTASESRGQPRDVYLPEPPEGMAHFSALSPDGKWVLVVEMDLNAWLPCRVVPFDGSSIGKRVGPPTSECTSATWSRDGRWMYFAAAVNGESHLWRQAFPEGHPQQITSGLNQERGVAVDPGDGSLITSLGSAQSTVWYHDQSGDRAVSVEGYAYRPLVSSDGQKVFYVVRRAAKRAFWIGELWSVDLASGRNERVLPDFLVRYYHVSRDGKYVVFDAFDKMERSRVWVAPIDRSQPPRQLTPEGEVEEQRPLFGSSGRIYFMQDHGQNRSLYRMNPEGSAREKLSSTPITFLVNVSPDDRFAVLWEPSQGAVFLPLDGGSPRLLCSCSVGPIFQDSPRVSWSADTTRMYVTQGSEGSGTTVIPWRGADTLTAAELTPDNLERIPGAQRVRETSIAPGPAGTRYAFARRAEQSNLYRIRLR